MNHSNGPLTTGDVALIFGVQPITVKRWADSGVLPHFRTVGGHYRFKAEDVEALKQSTSSEPAAARAG